MHPDIHSDCIAHNSRDIVPQVIALLRAITEPNGLQANECTLAGVYVTLEMIREVYRRRARALGITVEMLDHATKIAWPAFISAIQQIELAAMATQANAQA